MKYILDLRASDVGGAVVPGRIQPAPGLGGEDDLRHEPALTFLLHGFNVNRADGRAGLLRLAERLPSAASGGIVAVLWPGDHRIGPLSYPFEGNDADDSAAQLARYISLVVMRGVPLSFVSHSLGGRVALRTVGRVKDMGYRVAQVCLMAPAVDDFSVSNERDFRQAVEASARVAVLASRKDTVLKYAYTAGDLLQSFIFFRKESAGMALGYGGPKPFHGSAIPSQIFHCQIPEDRGATHSHCIPSAVPEPNQISATAFADDVLAGRAPVYP